MQPLLHLTDICLTLPNQGAAIFSALQFVLYPGERVAILGGEASGKSTLMRLMAGLLPPSSGKVVFNGQVGEIGLLFRDSANHFLTPIAKEEILLGMYSGADVEQESAMVQLLEFSGLPPQASTWSLAALSAAQQSRVAIAALFAGRPRLVLADEPGGCLDEAGEGKLAAILKDKCEQEQLAQVIFTSRLQRARQFSDKIFMLNQGGLFVENL